MFSNLSEANNQIGKYGLNLIKDELVKLLKPTIVLDRKTTNSSSAVDSISKLGGHPDVPADFEWHLWDNIPLTFIAQIAFAEVRRAIVSSKLSDEFKIITDTLPEQGVLYVFRHLGRVSYEKLMDKEQWRILYSDKPQTNLSQKSHPVYQTHDHTIQAAKSIHLDFHPKLVLPNFYAPDQEELESILITEELGEAYDEMLYENGMKFKYRFMGHPYTLQHDVLMQATLEAFQYQQYVSEGIMFAKLTEEQRAFVVSESKNWAFLLQIGIVPNWDYDSFLYVCIPKASLAKHRFEDCWVTIQTT